MVKITYAPSDWEKLQRILNENGTYMVTVHNKHIVDCKKAVELEVDKAEPGTQHEKAGRKPTK